jgi:hypothetical protein
MMETTENKTTTLTPFHVVSETWIDKIYTNYKGLWGMASFFIFAVFGWYLIYNLPFLFPEKFDIGLTYPPFTLTQDGYRLDIWYPKMITTNNKYLLIYTISANKTTKDQMVVGIDNILLNNTSATATPSFSHLTFSFSDKTGSQQQQTISISLPDSGTLSPTNLDVDVTLMTPNGNSKSGKLTIPVAQVGWLKYLWQVILWALSGILTIISNLQSGIANIISLRNSRKDIQN